MWTISIRSWRLADHLGTAEAMNIKPQQKYLILYRCDARCIQNGGRWHWNGNLSENNYICVLGLLNKHHRLKDLNSSHLLALISRGWKSKIKVSTGWFLLFFFLISCEILFYFLFFWLYFFLFYFILFFNFTILYWFSHISTWIHHTYTRVPHPEPSSLLPPCTIPLVRPGAPAPSIQYHASNQSSEVCEGRISSTTLF